MTNEQLRDAAWLELTKTTDSYPQWARKGFPTASHWKNAQIYLNQIKNTNVTVVNVSDKL